MSRVDLWRSCLTWSGQEGPVWGLVLHSFLYWTNFCGGHVRSEWVVKLFTLISVLDQILWRSWKVRMSGKFCLGVIMTIFLVLHGQFSGGQISDRQFSSRQFSSGQFFSWQLSIRQFSDRQFSIRQFSGRQFSSGQFSNRNFPVADLSVVRQVFPW